MEVLSSLHKDIQRDGVEVKTGEKYIGRHNNVVQTQTWSYDAGYIINSAGLWCDKISKMVGIDDYKLNYCKGEYYKTNLYPNKIHSLIYPIPTRLSLGTHIVLHLDGTIGFGPSAYYVDDIDYSMDDSHKKEFLNQINTYLNISATDISEDFTGIRPKIQKKGEPVQDFIITNEHEKGYTNFINLIGIESPGLTSSLSIAKHVRDLIK